jgi:hypothetical protein
MANSTIKTAFLPNNPSTLPWQPEHRYYFLNRSTSRKAQIYPLVMIELRIRANKLCIVLQNQIKPKQMKYQMA